MDSSFVKNNRYTREEKTHCLFNGFLSFPVMVLNVRLLHLFPPPCNLFVLSV